MGWSVCYSLEIGLSILLNLETVSLIQHKEKKIIRHNIRTWHRVTYLLDALSCCRLVNAPKLFRTVLKLARTWGEQNITGSIINGPDMTM